MIYHRIFRCVVAQNAKESTLSIKIRREELLFIMLAACNNGHLEIAGGTREVELFQRLKIPTYPFDRCFKNVTEPERLRYYKAWKCRLVDL